MTDLTPNHPAVEAAHDASMAWLADMRGDLPDDEMVCVLTAALPHLTADDLRDTPAGRALMAEAWEKAVTQFAQHGDVDTNPYRKDDA